MCYNIGAALCPKLSLSVAVYALVLLDTGLVRLAFLPPGESDKYPGVLLRITFLKVFPILPLLTFIAAGILPACGRIQTDHSSRSGDIRIELAVEPAQPAVGSAALLVTLTDASGRPIENARLEIEGNMTHAGMTPVLAEVSHGSNGRYQAPFEWTMGGDWIVTVKATLADGQIISRQFPVTVK